jgi:energy-coupling factor transporter ATP-binding protein EcfA2
VVTALPNFFDKLKLIGKAFSKEDFSLDTQFEDHIRDLGIREEPFNARAVSSKLLNDVAVGVDNRAEKRLRPPIIDYGDRFKTTLSLVKPSFDPLDFHMMTEVLAKLSPPYTLCLNLMPCSKEMSEARVRAASSQMNSGVFGQSLSPSHPEDIMAKVSNEGQRVFQVEYVIGLSRHSESECRLAMTEFENKLSALGDFRRGFYNLEYEHESLFAEGSVSNPFFEIEEYVPVLYPIVAAGVGKQVFPKDSLLFHRKNDSVDGFHLFNECYTNFSACIFGKSGSGKSVLTNLLTRAILNDPNNKIIKVDVGGSHSKETRALGGAEYKLSLSEPSGINPFRSALEASDTDAALNVLSNFLSVLMIENGEIEISKQMRGELESALSRYLLKNPKQPSLSDFINSEKGLPRLELLKRWGEGGVYKNAFKDRSDYQSRENQLRYYNFGEIFQASDPDYGQGGFAAIMAQFNFEMMKADKSKLVFMADETPFFINKCFSFFKFSTANVRKFGGSFITIAQNSSDVVIGGDTGILDNSNTKFLFSVDGRPEEFQERLRLSNYGMHCLENLNRAPGKFSEAVLSDGLSEKLLRLRVSPKEYWSMTSSHRDKTIISNLLQNIPGLSEEEAIRCLAASS